MMMETVERHYNHPASGHEVTLKRTGSVDYIVFDTGNVGITEKYTYIATAERDFDDRVRELIARGGEPTITLTRAHVVALFKSTLPSNIKVTGQCLRQLGVKEGSLFADYVNDLHQESRSLCRLLGAPEEWAAELVEGVVE